MNDIETRLRSTLESVAANTDVEDRLHEVVAYEAKSHHQRSGLLVAAAAFVVIGVGFGALLLVSTGGDQPPVGSTDPTHTAEATAPVVATVSPPTLPNGDPWPLPRLALDLDQLGTPLTVTSATSEFIAADADFAAKKQPYLQVLRRDSNLFEPPMIWIETNESGSDYLRSGFAEKESSQEFTINGVVFFVLEDGDRRLVTAGMPSGASVYVTGLGVETDDLITFVRGMSEAAPGPGWDVPEPPMGMQVVFEGHLANTYDPPGEAYQIVVWSAGTGAEMSVDNRGEVSFESSLYQVAGRATDQASVRSGTVRDRVAAVVDRVDSQVVVWRDNDEATAMLAVRNTALPLEQFTAAVIEVDEATWQAMEDLTVDSVEPIPPTTGSIPPAIPDGEASG